MRLHFLLKSDVLTAVTVVVPWTWGIGAWREKSTFGHRPRLFRNRCLKSLVFLLGGGNMSRGIWREKYILHFFGYLFQPLFQPYTPLLQSKPPPAFQTVIYNQGLCYIYSPKKNKGNRAKWKISGFNVFELFRWMDGFAFHQGSFSNDHSDGNDNGNGKKAIGLISKTTTLHVSTVNTRLRRESASFYVCGALEDKTTTFFFFSWTSI